MEFIIGTLGALFNRIRGGAFIETGNRYINAFAFGAIAYLATSNILFASLSILGMYIGSTKGWGQYIGATFGKEKYPLQEVEWIDDKISSLKPSWDGKQWDSEYKLRCWGVAGLAIRGGLYWAVPIGAASFALIDYSLSWSTVLEALQYGSNIISFALAFGLLFPASYILAQGIVSNVSDEFILSVKNLINKLMFKKQEAHVNRDGDSWELGEVIAGFALYMLWYIWFIN